jgi:hypothetical protein
MLRSLILLALLPALAAMGCRPRPPAAPPAPQTSAARPDVTPAPARDEVPVTQPAKPPANESAPPPSPAASSPLRELAARLSESDGDGGWRTNEKAATELEKLGPAGIAGLWPLLQDSSVDVRRGAAFRLLGEFNPARSEQVAALSALLADSDRTVRGIGLAAVRQMQSADQIAAVPKLAKMLDPAHEDKAANRAAIARLIGTLRREGAPGLPELMNAAMNDPDPPVRAASLMALSQVAAPDQAVAPLVKGLADKESSPRLVAAARLRQLGPAAAPAAKELAVALGDKEARVAETAAEALINIGQPAVEALAGQLTATHVNVRKLALACLAKIGPPAKSAESAIEKCKQDADPQVRQLAEAALRRLSGK